VSLKIEDARIDVVASPKGQVLWLRSECVDLSQLLQLEAVIKKEVKDIIKVTFN
jgi:hypothetical protein